jgi:hypothetical protein
MVKTATGLQSKQIVEEFEFRAVVVYLVKQVLLPKGSRVARAGHVAALGYLVRDHVLTLDNDDFEWLVEALLSVLHFDVNSTLAMPLTPEELTVSWFCSYFIPVPFLSHFYSIFFSSCVKSKQPQQSQ